MKKYSYTPAEFKVIKLRECAMPDRLVDKPIAIAKFWRDHVTKATWYDPLNEMFVVIMLNIRCKMIGFNLIALGSQSAVTVEVKNTFRSAIIQGASKIVLAHNHPSGDPTPSQADVKISGDLVRAGRIVGIDVLDMIVIGSRTPRDRFYSLQEHGQL